MSKIHFKSKLYKINDWLILRLDKESSSKLSSRGLVMVEGTINGQLLQTALEPDGKGSHWFRVDDALSKGLSVKEGDTVDMVIEQSRDWVEPKIPEDVEKALNDNPDAKALWKDITPFARWEWIRWISATKNPDTRKIRIEKGLSKLNAGKRRPCCFNGRECTVPYVSNKGVLLDPSEVNAVNSKIR